ncbi:MAG TPA: hypothetical protein P5241_03790, partial [Candidatus Paceibacterota bacterium]|nr:hypothetical protein [Candidatus Paceibacterota bacterium]
CRVTFTFFKGDPFLSTTFPKIENKFNLVPQKFRLVVSFEILSIVICSGTNLYEYNKGFIVNGEE